MEGVHGRHSRALLPSDTPRNVAEGDSEQGAHTTVPDVQYVLRSLLKELPGRVTSNDWSDDLRHMPDGNRDHAWQNCAKVVEKHDRDFCQAYREQIDTLLVFAGLFSAVVTAFAVESYQWLQADPADMSAVLLRDLVFLVAQSSNQTIAQPPLASPRLSDATIVRINVFWFVSLCLSLSAALVGILCKQWLREYERDVGGSPEMALAVRHIRFQGFEAWNVGTIVTSVPIALQLALALFLMGIVDFLWRLNTAVAACVTVVAGITLAFYLLTTFLPLIQYASICLRCLGTSPRTNEYCVFKAFTEAQCAFKSAQSWVVIRFAQPVIEYLMKSHAAYFNFHDPPKHYALVLRAADSWVTFDINWTKRREHIHFGPQAAYETLAWVARNLEEVNSSTWIWHCVWARRLGDPGDTGRAVMDIECIADAYPTLLRLDDNVPPVVRTQSLAFQCSLRTDLPADTKIEQLLHIAPTVGVNSRWTQAALNLLVSMHHDTALHLSDDVAAGLLHLAELQTQSQADTAQLLAGHDSPYLPFFQIVNLIYRGSRLRGRLLPAMCAFAVSWLAADPPGPVAAMAENTLSSTISHYVSMDYDPGELRASPGVLLVAQLASAISELWPDLPRRRYRHQHRQRRIFLHLLDIWKSAHCGHHIHSAEPLYTELGDVQGSAGDARASVSPSIAHVIRDDPRECTKAEIDVNSAAISAVDPLAAAD